MTAKRRYDIEYVIVPTGRSENVSSLRERRKMWSGSSHRAVGGRTTWGQRDWVVVFIVALKGELIPLKHQCFGKMIVVMKSSKTSCVHDIAICKSLLTLRGEECHM